MNKRKFTHTKLELTIMVVYLSLITVGLSSVIYNLMFNNPTITFGGF